jgi:RHS repeat-associated protein
VNPSTSVNVQYQYADGSSNTIRPAALVYPNGRVLHYDYGTSAGIDDSLSRIASIIDSDGTTHLADYTRVGHETFVEQSSPEPKIAWSLINGSGADPYSGLDQFNRVVDNRWYSTAASADLDRIQHGYDRASNRLWRRNTVAEAVGVYLDELYGNDGLYRLAEMQRGQLAPSNNAIISGTLSFAQGWGLDATGNWSQFWENDTGSSWNLQQLRIANSSNEITSITGGAWAQPAYDNAGNMVLLPQSGVPSATDTAAFDGWNRTMLFGTDGAAVQNVYDGLNRRISKIVSSNPRDYYYSDGWQVLEERLSSSSTDREFTWGLRYVDDLVLRDRGAERLYALQDPNWNVTAICDVAAAVRERYAYSPYGSPRYFTSALASIDASAVTWEMLFASYRFDAESGCSLARNRFLVPLLGRWGSRDPIVSSMTAGNPMKLSHAGVGLNLYAYLVSFPTNAIDPLGKAARGHAPRPPREWCKLSFYYPDAYKPLGAAGPAEFMCGAVALSGVDGAVPMTGYENLDGMLQGLTQDRGCCISDLTIADHGSNGQVWFGGHHLDANDAATLCRYLCPGATIRLLGCGAASHIPFGFDCVELGSFLKPCKQIGLVGAEKPAVQTILENCRKIDHVTGCTGWYNFTPVPSNGPSPLDRRCCPKDQPRPICLGSLRSFRRR